MNLMFIQLNAPIGCNLSHQLLPLYFPCLLIILQCFI